MQLRVGRNLIEGRINLDIASLAVASDLELNWWSYGGGDVPLQLNLRLILMWTAESKLAQPVAPRVGIEWSKEIYGR